MNVEDCNKNELIQALDEKTGVWCKAKVIEVDSPNEKVMISWVGFPKTYDCWVSVSILRVPVVERNMPRNWLKAGTFPTVDHPKYLERDDEVWDSSRNLCVEVDTNDPFNNVITTKCGTSCAYEYLREMDDGFESGGEESEVSDEQEENEELRSTKETEKTPNETLQEGSAKKKKNAKKEKRDDNSFSLSCIDVVLGIRNESSSSRTNNNKLERSNDPDNREGNNKKKDNHDPEHVSINNSSGISVFPSAQGEDPLMLILKSIQSLEKEVKLAREDIKYLDRKDEEKKLYYDRQRRRQNDLRIEQEQRVQKQREEEQQRRSRRRK